MDGYGRGTMGKGKGWSITCSRSRFVCDAGPGLFVMPVVWGVGAWPMESSSNDFER